jgi:predicted AAA+ superfamily ATPase
MISKSERSKLYTALDNFTEAFRPYIVETLTRAEGEKWPAKYVECLTFDQRENWNNSLKRGSSPVVLIDFHHWKSFAIRNKELLKEDFGRKVGDLPNWLSEIADVRHKIAHFNNDIEDDEATKAWIHMRAIAKAIKMTELEVELLKLEKGQVDSFVPTPVVSNTNISNTTPWYNIIQPHFDIRNGQLDESVFAANLAEVSNNAGREVYRSAEVFFSKTYFTAGIRDIAKRVILGLNGGQDSQNRVISLQTGFGGGKTHTLISLYHIANSGKKLIGNEKMDEVFKQTGIPTFDNVNVAVFTNTTNDPVQGRIVNGVQLNTIWGELAYQLGGQKAYDIIKANDEQKTKPSGLFKRVLEQAKPCLILIDELADYCVSASAVTVGGSNLKDQTISFMQELTEAVAGTDNCVLIATLPISAQEVAASPESQQILSALENRIVRVGANLKPVEDDEIFEVVRRRLFEDNYNTDAINTVIDSYSMMYNSLMAEIPSYALKQDYRDRMKKSYPFHPELIDVFRHRWASTPNFQRTRGILRILASIVSDLWKRKGSLVGNNSMIHTSDVNFTNVDALTSQITMLYGANWDSVISADVSGASSNAFRIDSEVKTLGDYNITQGISSTILLGTFGSQGQNRGYTMQELKLCIIKPNSYNHNDINGALDRFENAAHFLYYNTSNEKRYWFHTKPNINILINQAKNEIGNGDIEAEIIKRLNAQTANIELFGRALVDPSNDIPEQQKPTLVILSPKFRANQTEINGNVKPLIEKIATKKGTTDRIYRNTILFLLCNEIGFTHLSSNVRDYLACNKIKGDYANQLERDQADTINRTMNESNKSVDASIVIAYSLVVKFSAREGVKLLKIDQFRDNITNQITSIISKLYEEEWMLKAVGYNTLRNNNLLPSLGNPIKVKDVHDAFLRFDDKPMIANRDAIQNSILRYCNEGHFSIGSGDGRIFSKYYFKESVPFFDVLHNDYWLVAPEDLPAKDSITENSNNGPNNIPSTPSIINSDYPILDDDFFAANDTASNEAIIPSVSISGILTDKVQFMSLGQYFLVPFKDNSIEMEVKFKIKTAPNSPLTENDQKFKRMKEAVNQLGFDLEIEK